MRIIQVLGALLMVGGLYVLVKSPTYPADKSLFTAGQFEAHWREHREIPPWVGGAALAGGLVLVLAGLRRR